ncbi:hypothetical protein ACSBR2_013562 [Camellia fascicularis]
MEESVHSPKINVEQVFTLGFIRSFSGSKDGLGHSINLEVDLAQALSKNINGKGFLSLNHFIQAWLEGFTSFARLHLYKAATVSKHTSKSVIYRPTTAALARSDLSKGVTSLNNVLLNEAKATIQLEKSLGINFNGKEDDVVNKIIELELKDKERSK